jgi:cytochrome c oxidase cbb3-type subunit I/II
MSAQRGAIVASAYLGLDVILVVSNLLLSLRGSSGKVGSHVSLRFIWFGVVAYLVVSLQGSMQAFMPVNRFIHFSDWVIGHSHLAMIGFASFTAAGALAHIWSNMPGAKYNPRAMGWSFWLLTIGLSLMVIDLTAAGLVEGQMWVSRAPWIDSVRAVYPYWFTRLLSGLPILAGFALFWIGLLTGPRNAAPATAEFRAPNEDTVASLEVEGLHAAPSILSYAFVVVFVAGFGFFVLSFIALGIVPAMQLQAEIRRTAPRAMQPLTAQEEHGRQIYGREGCAYCHTEQVRTITADVQRFGAPTAAWETQYDYPQLWGTRRIGPDLSRENGLRTDDWQYAHLYNPRSTVPDSVMPGYSWMFTKSAAEPKTDALDLVAYVGSLGRQRALAGEAGNEQVDHGAAMEMSSSYGSQGVPDTRPRITVMGLDDSAPIFASARAPDPNRLFHGRQVYDHNCSGCHGLATNGQGLAAAALRPRAIDLHLEHFSDAHLATILWDGVSGSAMPPWRQLEKNDLQDVTMYVQSIQAPISRASMAPADLVAAQQIYASNCINCHGANGRGDGPAAAALKPSPVNFNVRQPSQQRAWEVMNEGISGSAMPAWKSTLKPEQLKLLVPYVQQMYGTGNGRP